jgi:hypothetical protein
MREKLAALSHRIWAKWMMYLFAQCTMNEDGTATIPKDKVERWQRQMNTDYPDLSEKEKDSDRHQADLILGLIDGIHKGL